MARERKFSKEELFHETKELLLLHGYEGFSFSVLADHLHVSRGTIYKYYDNKEELVTSLMIHEMNQFLSDLKEIEQYPGFDAQFDFLLEVILKKREIHRFIGINAQIPIGTNESVKKNKEVLDKLHLDMYGYLQNFIQLGKKESKLKPHLANGLMLGFIFQSVAIPNHFGIPHAEWIQSIKEIISHGMLVSK
ncbi:TetR/AcrR family transcriptional regulator [Niallia endozanthoxylica]|uniref:TetR/AcrR family transcriptional regulator n=1 Tax=Niallia endozanthoxylica TaxID=2036016 RepID=A0A5J5H899_9BACI|nr:TetR/AcrR family transcriptional regulator [Niallia endozanthoxylica]KAA9016955.1 TetR/AcrR family transcriptional regulator [Niallia endozanthoxylica]